MNGKPEHESRRDGFLSSYPEWHSAINGFYAGFTSHPLHHPGPPTEGQPAEDYDGEEHYWRGGYVAGTYAQLGVIACFLGLVLALTGANLT